MSNEMSLLSGEISAMVSTKPNTKSGDSYERSTCSTDTDEVEVSQCLTIPSFDPVCSFNQIKSHTVHQEDVAPEEDEEVAPKVIQPARHLKTKSEKRVKILSPIQEENQSEYMIDTEQYKAIFKVCHSDLKKAKIGS